MKVYKIEVKVSNVTTYLLDYPEGNLDLVSLNSLSKTTTWITPKIYLHSPQMPMNLSSIINTLLIDWFSVYRALLVVFW